jgi:hypothetical protein
MGETIVGTSAKDKTVDEGTKEKEKKSKEKDS